MIRTQLARRIVAGTTAFDGRVYRNVFPQASDSPAAVFQRSGTAELFCTTGALGQARSVFRVTVRSESSSECESIVNAMRTNFHAWGASTAATTAGVHEAMVINEDDAASPEHGELGYTYIALDVEIFHDE